MSPYVRARQRKGRPSVELLETRALLSALSANLTTNQSVYEPGQPIKMTFTETNTSNQQVRVEDGPSIDGFVVTENGTTVWKSNAGYTATFLHLVTLNPGQSLTVNATWNGAPGQGTTPILTGGTFTVTNQLNPQGASATFQISPAFTTGVTTDGSVYQAGEPIVFTYTKTNTSALPLTITVDPTDFTVTASGGGTIWQSNPANGPAAGVSQTLQPGQSVTQTATWNGAQTSAGPSYSLWGSFVVSNPNAPTLSSAFEIKPPLATSISTSHSVYQVGQSVDMTFTETNSSPDAIVVVPSGTFTVTNAASTAAVFSQTVGQNALVTLQPGQSITQTATWTATAVGSYGLSYQNSELKTDGSFQVVAASTGANPPGQNPQPGSGGSGSTGSNPQPVSGGSGSTGANPQPVTGGSGSTGANPQPVTGGSGSTGQNPQPVAGTTPVVNPQQVTATLATNHQSYGAGQAVTITLTLKNTSSQTITVAPSSAHDGFSVISGSTMVWHTSSARIINNRAAAKAKARTLAPGQSITFQAIWNGRPSQRGAGKLPGGWYTVMASEAGYSAETTIEVASPKPSASVLR